MQIQEFSVYYKCGSRPKSCCVDAMEALARESQASHSSEDHQLVGRKQQSCLEDHYYGELDKEQVSWYQSAGDKVAAVRSREGSV